MSQNNSHVDQGHPHNLFVVVPASSAGSVPGDLWLNVVAVLVRFSVFHFLPTQLRWNQITGHTAPSCYTSNFRYNFSEPVNTLINIKILWVFTSDFHTFNTKNMFPKSLMLFKSYFKMFIFSIIFVLCD